MNGIAVSEVNGKAVSEVNGELSLKGRLHELEEHYQREAGRNYIGPADPAGTSSAQGSPQVPPGGSDSHTPSGPTIQQADTFPGSAASHPTVEPGERAPVGQDRPIGASPVAEAEKAEAPTMRVDTAAPMTAKPVVPKDGGTSRSEPEASGGGPGRGGGAGGGGNGRGSGGGSPLNQRTADRDFRDVLGKGLATCRRNLVTVAIFSFVVNILVLSIPIYLFQVSDRVLTSRSIDTLVMLTIVVIGAIAAHVLLDLSRRYILMRIAVEAESKLGAPVLSAAAKASQSGSNREFQTLADMQQVRQFVTGPVLLTMLDVPATPIYLLVVFMIHPALGFIVTTTGAVLMVIAFVNQKATAVPFGRANAFATRANLQAEAMARNAQVINAMGMIPEGVKFWGRETAESLKSQVVGQDRNALLTALSKFVRLTTQVAILGYGAWLSLQSEVTAGMIIAASIIAGRALAPLEGTIEGWRSFVQARSAYARVKMLLQNSPLNFDRLLLPRPEGRLSVERLLYVPPPNKKVLLNGITFQLEPGESLAIVGASGAGKSTLGRMLVGSISPTAGNVRLDLMDLRNWDPQQFGQSVGYLPQDIQLFPASIKANIARMREDTTDEAIFDAAEMADVHEMISQFAHGYETQIGLDGSPLSGGQKQRIGLARAFFGDPRLVVLDEPNSNLDAPGDRALARAFARAKERRTTVVAITQRPALLRSVDKILVIKDGTLQAFGKRDDVIPLISGRKPGDGPSKLSSDGLPLLDA